MALKILQNTVYQMVERISECSGVATNGLKAEISALQGKQEPLEEMIGTMKKTLESSKELLVRKPECSEEVPSQQEITKLSKILESHVHALGLCREVGKGCQKCFIQQKSLQSHIEPINLRNLITQSLLVR